ncbi:MAG: hypothetical protein JKY01_02085 [Pseudomonadales bacterium]|nr:hypothetical protein [Pseudomonadales bacterium]
MIPTNESTQIYGATINMTHRMLALIIFTACITTTAILNVMPSMLFLAFTTTAFLGWSFHKPLLTFFGALKEEHQREIQPNLAEQVIHIKQLKGFRKNSSLRAFYGNAANHADIGDGNIISFPSSTPQNRHQ